MTPTASQLCLPQWVTDAIAEYQQEQERAAVKEKAARTRTIKEARMLATERLRQALDQCEMPYWDFGPNDLYLRDDAAHWYDWYLLHDGYRFSAERGTDTYGLVIHIHCAGCNHWLPCGPCWSFADVGRVFTEELPRHQHNCPGSKP